MRENAKPTRDGAEEGTEDATRRLNSNGLLLSHESARSSRKFNIIHQNFRENQFELFEIARNFILASTSHLTSLDNSTIDIVKPGEDL